MDNKNKIIEEMAKVIDDRLIEARVWLGSMNRGKGYWIAQKLVEHYQPKLPEDSVVLSKEEYENLKSLYDCQHGSIMTSSIGDLPLTIEGLRKAVDEIARLINVQTELQVLNAKYYNEAKDSRRELKQARKETAEKILFKFESAFAYYDNEDIFSKKAIFECLEEIVKSLGVEIKE